MRGRAAGKRRVAGRRPDCRRRLSARVRRRRGQAAVADCTPTTTCRWPSRSTERASEQIGLSLRSGRRCCAAAAIVDAAAATASEPRSPDREILVMVRHPPDHYRPNGAYGGGYGDDWRAAPASGSRAASLRQYGLTSVDDWPMPMIGVDCFVMAGAGRPLTEPAAAQVSHDPMSPGREPVELYATHGGAAPQRSAVRRRARRRHGISPTLHRIATGRGYQVAVDRQRHRRPPSRPRGPAARSTAISSPAGRTFAEQHGTGVAGIIAAKADNGIGIAGVAPGARLLGLRACWQTGPPSTACDTLSLAKASISRSSRGPT